MDAPRLTRNARLGVCMLLYLVLAGARGLVWEPTHDEGVTWLHALAPVELAGLAAPAPVAALYPALDGVRSPSDILDALMGRAGMHPPLYYLLVRGWAAAVGTEGAGFRLPFYLVGALALIGLARIARSLVPERESTWAVLLLAVSPWFIGFSSFARPYPLALCLSIWSTAAVIEIAESEKPTRWRIAFVVFSLLGLYVLYHYVFAIIWQGAALAVLAWRDPIGRRRSLFALAAMAGAIALGFAPWLARLAAHLEATSTGVFYFSEVVPPWSWPSRGALLLLVFALGEGLEPPALQLAAAALGIASLPLVAGSFSRRDRANLTRPSRVMWATAPLLPLAIAVADAWHGTHTLFESRTSFALLPLLLLLLVRGWTSVGRAFVRRAGLMAWCALLAATSLVSAVEHARSPTPFEAVAAFAARADDPGHVVVVSSARAGFATPFLLSLRAAGVENLRIAHASPDELLARVRAALADPTVRQLTLVSMNVSEEAYGYWSPELRHEVLRAARDAGWRAGTRTAGEAAAAGPASVRSLWIIHPVRPFYFAM